MNKVEISRTAQLIAQCWFGLGKRASVIFHTPERVTEKAQQGLNELVAAGMITKHENVTYGGAVEYKATDKIGFPLRDYPWADKNNPEEMFPVLKPVKLLTKKGRR